jgi:RNA polymerase sigma factor (sigma-70 family)
VVPLLKSSVDGVSLLAEIEKGSLNAFDQFYDQYCSMVLGIALKMLGNKVDAEDLCHDVFLEIYRTAKSYNPDKGSVEAWLAVKTKSRCIDKLRRRKYKKEYDDETFLHTIPDQEMVESKVISLLERQSLLDAIKHLPAAQQEVIYESYFNELTQDQLSQKKKRPLGTVKSQIRYGIRNLQKLLAQRSFQSPRGEKKNGM